MAWKCRTRPDTLWSAMRAVFEGAQGTPELLSAMSGRAPATIVKRIETEGWRPNATPRQMRVLRYVDRLTARMEAIQIGGTGDSAADKAELGLVHAQTRAGERIAALAREADEARSAEKPSDEDIAEVLQRINDRIIELAREFAREFPDRLAGDEFPGERGEGG